MTTHIPTNKPAPGLADPLSERSWLDRLAAQAFAALGTNTSAPVSAAPAPLAVNQTGAPAIATNAPSPFPGGAGGAPLPAIPAGSGAGRTGAPALDASALHPPPGGQGAPEIPAGAGIGRSGAPALDASAQAQPPGGPGAALIPAIPAGSEVGAVGAPEFDTGLGRSKAAVTAAAKSLAPGFGAPPATEGILPVILPVSAKGLSGAPAPAVPAAGTPGLPTSLPDALTPRSVGLPGDDDLKRLLEGLNNRPHQVTDGLPGRSAPQFYFLDPQALGWGTRRP